MSNETKELPCTSTDFNWTEFLKEITVISNGVNWGNLSDALRKSVNDSLNVLYKIACEKNLYKIAHAYVNGTYDNDTLPNTDLLTGANDDTKTAIYNAFVEYKDVLKTLPVIN